MENESNTLGKQEYKMMGEIDHVLSRPGMYVGSTMDEIVESNLYQPSSNKIIPIKKVLYNAGILKLFDEIFTNSIDESRRPNALFRITNINVKVLKDGTITVFDNGGIVVKKHEETGMWIPEMIFGHLRTSSNYNDNEDRSWIGTNGLGSKLTNVFSTIFRVRTADGKNLIKCCWKNNMRDLDDIEVTSYPGHFTETTWKLDFEKLNIQEAELNMSTVRLMQKICIDAAANNPNLTIKFETDLGDGKLNSTWHFDTFGEYIKLYCSPEQYDSMISYVSSRFKLCVIPTNIGTNIGFVNGIVCSQGTHIKIIEKQIVSKILDWCVKNEMELITERDILSRISIFVTATVRNPTYDSQTKEKLTNKLSVSDLKLTQKFFDELLNSELVEALKDYYSVKYAAEKKKELRKLNQAIKGTKKSKKLIEATGKSAEKELWLFEGNSAANGFRKHRNPLTQCAYLLRGKIRNTFDLKATQILENQELREICATLKLQFGQPKENIKNLDFTKIIVASDADVDGAHICGLFLSFIVKHFPELINAGKIYRAKSPIIIVINHKTKEKEYYYTLEEFETVKNQIPKNCEIRYTKGLGGLEDSDYRIMLREQKLVLFNIENEEDYEYIKIWFEKSAVQRKQLLLESEDYEDQY